MSRLSGGSPSPSRWSASPTPRAPRFRRSELAAVGRRELLRWVNRTVGVDYVQVESCADGVALAQLIDAAYPDARVPLYRLDFATRHEHDRARNLEVVRATLDRLDLDVPLDVKEVSRGAYRACDEALRWLYLVVQRERPKSATRGYDGRKRRLEALEKRRYLARAPSKSPGWRSAASWDDENGETNAVVIPRDPLGTPRAFLTPTPSSSSFAFKPRLSVDDGVAYSDSLGSQSPLGSRGSRDELWEDGGREAEESTRGKETDRVGDELGDDDSEQKKKHAPLRDETRRAYAGRDDVRTPVAPSIARVGNREIEHPESGTKPGEGVSTAEKVVRPATAPPRTRRRPTVSVLASAHVDIRPPRAGTSPREEAELSSSSGDEIPVHRRPSSARLYTPRRSLDKWAERARARLRLFGERSTTRAAPRDPPVTSLSVSSTSEDKDARETRTSKLRSDEKERKESRVSRRDPSRAFASSETETETETETGDEESDFFENSSRRTRWTASPPGSAERAARLRRARAEALVRTRVPLSSNAFSSRGSEPATRFETRAPPDATQTQTQTRRHSDASPAARLLASTRAEVAEIKARESARRRRRDAERAARLEAEALAEARAAEERRLALEAEEAALHAREVASARREVRLEEARARRERRRRQVREALRLDDPTAEAYVSAPRAPGRVSFSADVDSFVDAAPRLAERKASSFASDKRLLDLQSLAEYLKWELAAELKRFEAAKRETAAAVRERDEAILRLGIAETRRRLAGPARAATSDTERRGS